MPYHDFLWMERSIQKVTDNGLTVEEVEFAILATGRLEKSRNSNRDVYIGWTPSGELICVPFDVVDAMVIAPVTAFRI